MKFKANNRRRALEYEKDWVEKWKADKTFEKSVQNRPIENSWIFYDGPPFISGVPHHGTLLSSMVKDAVPRYQTMKGKRVERVWGWDCHGLPAERYTEGKLGIKSRQEVIEYGIEKYIIACRDNMVQTSNAWEDVVDRIGRWVEFKGAYKTMDKDYMESVWWAFKTLHDKGKIYEGERVLMYCTTDATPLSKAEVTMDAGAYQDVTDPSVYVKFKIDGDFDIDDFKETATGQQKMGQTKKAGKPAYLLAWTTTPWTLPANTALAVGPNLEYVIVETADEYLVMANSSELLKGVFTDSKKNTIDHKIVSHSIQGRHLVDRIKRYKPLFVDHGKMAHKVLLADYVTDENGTGIVHLAPAYGEEDFELAQQKNIPIVHVIDENGIFTEGDWQGENVWEINKQIAKDLHARGIVWKIDYTRHSYPHCHRCNTRLMYRAHPSWFFDINGQRQQMLDKNSSINWFPTHIKNGRFQKNIEQAPDWNISRDRFWATPLPVWKSPSGKIKVVGSYNELEDLSGIRLDDYHRPWIDDVKFELAGETYTRIDKVMDSWFEAGSMPFAQFHYPFENKEKFEDNFPGDFIVEYVGQVRAWFYYMHAMSVALFGENSFKNVIVTGNVAGNDGRKMSKSYGNYTDPNELMDKFSADSLRYLLLSSPLLNGEDFALHDKDVGDVARKLGMIWNMYDFFTMYAEVDGWEFNGKLQDPLSKLTSPLDIWVVSRLHQLASSVESSMDAYNIPEALSQILPFIDDASNWYVRRSRRRFWKSEDDKDKNDAYTTLHYVLARMAYLLAPFTPFLAEELHSKLTGDAESIHLKDWWSGGNINQIVMDEMEKVRDYVNQGLSQRAAAGIKIRQPLSLLTINDDQPLSSDLTDIVAEEVNVKRIDFKKSSQTSVSLNTNLTNDLRQEGFVREVVRVIQQRRKDSGLEVSDHIYLEIYLKDTWGRDSLKAHQDYLIRETLADDLNLSNNPLENEAEIKIADQNIQLNLRKA